MALCIVSVVCRWWVLNPDYPWFSLFSNALMAPALTCIWQIIPSMAADCVDYDELKTGTRNEGVYAATFLMVHEGEFHGRTLAGRADRDLVRIPIGQGYHPELPKPSRRSGFATRCFPRSF